MAAAPALDIVTLDALSCTPHTRTQDQLACISKLLSSFPLYSRLLPDALEAAARQVQSLCLSAGAELPRPSDGKDCILTLLSGQLSLICGSPEDPDLQELLQQLHDTNGISESDSDCEDAAGSGSSLSGRTGAGGMAAAGTTTAGHGARVSTACFEIQSCHWGDFLVQAERRSASPSPPPRSSSSSPVGGASSSPRTKDVSGSSRSVQSSGPLLPAGGPRFKQATRTVTFGRPRQQQPSSLGGHKEEVEQPKRGLWYRVKKAVQVTSDRIAQQQQERMAEAQAQLQQMLLSQHAAAAKGMSSHAATNTSSSTAAAARAGGTASPEAGQQQRRQEHKEGWLKGISLSQCQPGSSFTAAPFTLQGLPEGLDATIPVEVAPTCCLAAVAEGRQQLYAIWISRQAFANVLALHQDRANCRAMAQLCRMPCLRHSPLRELQKMAPYMQQVTLPPGTVMLEQDRVVAFVYFLLSGQVQLQVSAAKGRSHSSDPFTDTKNSYGSAAAGTISSSKVTWATGALDTGGLQEEGAAKESHSGDVLVVGVRGPGAILGDDCVREKRMAVTVVAVTEIAAIRMLPQKFLTALDPLTARLFGRLRNQQGAGQALLVKDGIAAKNRCELADHFRNTVLGQVYKATDVPSTLVRQHNGNSNSSSSDSRRPAWVTSGGAKQDTGLTMTTAGGGAPRGLTRTVTMKAGGFGPGRGALDTQLSTFGLARTTTGVPGVGLGAFGRASSSLGMARTLSSSSLRGRSMRQSRSGLFAESSFESTTSGVSCSSRSMSGHLQLSGRHARDPALPSVMATVDQIRARSTSPDLLKTAVWKTIDPRSGNSLRASTGSLRATLSRQQQQQQLGTAAPEDEVWAECLPRGLTREMCEALGSSESVDQLVQIIADVDDTRRSQGPMLPDLTATSSSRGTLTRSWVPDRTRSPEQHWSQDTGSVTPASLGLTITTTALLTADGEASASSGGAVTTASLPEQRAYIDLVECCCLAVLTMAVAPGQTSGTGASTGLGSGAIASVIDDVAASWSAVAHDEGMQLVRWSPWQWLVVQDLEDDAAASAPVFCSTVFKLISRWQKVLNGEPGPYIQLGIGAALGSCFLTQEGGFVTSVSGIVYEAAEKLSCTALDSARPTSIMVTDGLALLLGSSHALRFAPGGYLLKGPRSIGISDVGGEVAACRDSGGGDQPALGPRGQPSHGGGGAASSINLVSPNARRSAKQRRQIRRKFEALERLLEVGEALMVPPPEEMLTQPPPVTDLEEVCRVQAPAAHGSSRLGSAGRPGRPSMMLTSLSFTPSAADASSGGESGGSGGPALTSRVSMRRKPALSIQVAGAAEEDLGPLTASGKVSFAPPSPTKGAGQGLFPGLQNVLKGTMSAAAMAATPKAGRDGTWGGSGIRAKVWQDVAAAREDTASTSGGAVSTGGGSPHSETGTTLPVTTPGGRKRSMFGAAQQLPAVMSEFSEFSSDCKTPQDRRGTNSVRFVGGTAAHTKDAAAAADDAGVGDDNTWAGRASKRSSMAGPAVQAGAGAKGVRFSAAGEANRPPSRSRMGDAFADGSSNGGGAEDMEAPHFEAAVAGSRALGSTGGAAYFLQRLSESAESVNLSVLGLPHLPVQLLRLDNLSILAASNNRLQQLSCQETEVPTLTSPRCGVPRSRSPSPSRSTAAAEGARSSTSRRKPAGQEGTAAAGGAAAGLGTPLPDTLTVLGWAANELEELPEDLGQQLPLLEVADLTCNRLTVLPDSIGMLTNLRCLSLAHNELGQLPSSFSCLVSLQQLHLEGNQLRYMPPGLQALQQLQVLNLSHNGLRQLPAAVWGMQQLRELDARHNQLRQLPTNCLNTMPSLHILRLAGNQLRDIRGACSGSSSSSSVDNVPPGRGATSSAGSLGEQGDEGEEEREGVQAVAAVAAGAKRAPLQRLQTLDVSGNLLEQLPSWLPPSLTELNASGNCLASLPVDLFSRLSRRLVVLQLAHNQLPGLPMHLTCLTALRLLSVGGNPGIDGLEDGAHTAGDAGRGQQQPGATYLPGSWPLQWIAAQRRGETWPGIQGGKP